MGAAGVSFIYDSMAVIRTQEISVARIINPYGDVTIIV